MRGSDVVRVVPPTIQGCANNGRNHQPERFELALTFVTLALTAVACAFLAVELAAILRKMASRGDVPGALGQILFMLIVALLIWGNLVYQLTRLAFFRRRLDHRPAPAWVLEEFYDGAAPSFTVLVPSYKEEPQVVQRTLFSAALQDYPNRRVVLLIDDPAHPVSADDERALRHIESLPVRLQTLFADAAKRFARECAAYESRQARGAIDLSVEAERIGHLYQNAAQWLEERASHLVPGEPGDELLRDKVFLLLAREHRARAQRLVSLALAGALEEAHLLREYRRLASLFRVELTSFQRKRYVNLAHEPNKAMNLNAFIGLMGKHLREVRRADGLHLEYCAQDLATWSVPDADYLLMLDADSIIVPGYAPRLMHYMGVPGNERVAVAQTPYSTIPAVAGTLENIAGATTDIQYNIHQGFTAFGGTYWVGANALVRKRALEDIAQMDRERGFLITRFILDRTVIEDTESSIDLVSRGWRLYNYPERLAYSATPPDFGSLLIQRRRWANGGLIILPKLLRYLLRGPSRTRKAVEGFFRCHYLASIAAVNVGLLIMLACPFEENLRNPWLPLSATPYFFLYARDLTCTGYRYTDLLRVYALNLMLIPINLGGVLKSLAQALTGHKTPFGRTPKVAGRTAALAPYVLAEYGLLGWWLVGATGDAMDGHYAHLAFALTNAGFLAYAIYRYIGWRNSVEDLRSGIAFARGWVNGARSRPLDGRVCGKPKPAPLIDLASRRLRDLRPRTKRARRVGRAVSS
jgi:cellulose synthase/poly-beta-1,6-N-acetylglucosamine synthase-like glycosyltransferase